MKLLKNYTLTWWQMGLFKVYVASVGLLVGAYFPEIVMQYKNILFGLFIVMLIYFVYALVAKKI